MKSYLNKIITLSLTLSMVACTGGGGGAGEADGTAGSDTQQTPTAATVQLNTILGSWKSEDNPFSSNEILMNFTRDYSVIEFSQMQDCLEEENFYRNNDKFKQVFIAKFFDDNTVETYNFIEDTESKENCLLERELPTAFDFDSQSGELFVDGKKHKVFAKSQSAIGVRVNEENGHWRTSFLTLNEIIQQNGAPVATQRYANALSSSPVCSNEINILTPGIKLAVEMSFYLNGVYESGAYLELNGVICKIGDSLEKGYYELNDGDLTIHKEDNSKEEFILDFQDENTMLSTEL